MKGRISDGVDTVRAEHLELQKAMTKAIREPMVGTSHVSHLTLSCRQEEDVLLFCQAWVKPAAVTELSKSCHVSYQAFMPMGFPFQAHLLCPAAFPTVLQWQQERGQQKHPVTGWKGGGRWLCIQVHQLQVGPSGNAEIWSGRIVRGYQKGEHGRKATWVHFFLLIFLNTERPCLFCWNLLL